LLILERISTLRIKLTPAIVAKLKASGPHQEVFWDEAMAGFGCVVTPSGHKSFCVQYRANGKSRRATIKFGLGIEAARREARAIQGVVARGADPVGAKRAARAAVKTTLAGVFEAYTRIEGSKLRSAKARKSIFDRQIAPALGARPIAEIRRSEVASLLDGIEVNQGPRAADIALALLRRLMAWHEGRDDEFRTPIPRSVQKRHQTPGRDRILSDDELRVLWSATADQEQPYNRLTRFALLTACRRDEASAMRWSEIQDDVWTIPSARYKTAVEMEIPLSGAARAVLDAAPRIAGTADWIFTLDGRTHIGGFSRLKAELDVRMREVSAVEIAPWVFHDLRRTARSLMSRAGVPPDNAERALGHAIRGVRSVYDRHSYLEQKREAFEALAAQIDRILHPSHNVVALRGGKAAG
jgi:integrase